MRIEFTEQLGDGQFVEIRDPRKMSWGQQKQITSALQDDTIYGQLETAERIAVAMVRSGYVLDADDKPVAFPLTAENVVGVPSVVIEEVAKKFAEIKAAVTPKN
jgi:hypothetical protein